MLLVGIIVLPILFILTLILILVFNLYKRLKSLLETKYNRIIAIRLDDEQCIFYYQQGQQQSQDYQRPVFQSKNLVILPIKIFTNWQQQRHLVIFKDSIKNAKMTDLNRLLTVNV